jgi:hypothetical protein
MRVKGGKERVVAVANSINSTRGMASREIKSINEDPRNIL